ncbi:AMP-binding protein [Nocardioides sp. AE5]|uniref:AMP-dependent synthetase/ligase n=1 Tax=Nocardioides sp. AE5 TaxID=2962573 RepID=UPI002882A105|nr:AMP-binding protein [Nocardioides sp. AE5]MDT0202025.1 AMP-binding protein [Nocardioides sp. AE5]
MTDVTTARTAIEEQIAGQTLATALQRTVETYGDQPAYSDKVGITSPDGTGWRTLTWRETREQALDLAAGLVELGVDPGDTVALMASSRIEHVLADLAAVHAGATPMSIYATLAPEQVAYVAGQSEPAVVVLEGADQLARWEAVLSSGNHGIKRVVVIDESAMPTGDLYLAWSDLVASGAAYRAAHGTEVEGRWQGISPSQPITILYTSGTTGNPKGVVLSHANVLFEAASSTVVAGTTEPGITISYLPFAHIAERILGMYIPQSMGGHVHMIADPAQLVGALAEVRPTRFFGVPRVWEKIRTGVSARLAAEPDEAKRAGVEQAMAIGLEYVEALQFGNTPSPELTAKFEAVDGAVLGLLRALLGLDRVEWAASAAAPMPEDVARFFAGLGMRIYDVYGMTETTSAITACGPDAFRLGTVGRALAGIEVKVAEDGEILARGPVTMAGYHRNEEATRELIDADGWVHTGDIGTIDEDGFLKVVDRKKEMIITSSGKNIAPSNIENYLKESPLVGHALVYGEGKPYVVAVLTLDPEIAPLVAAKFGIEGKDLAALAEDPQILAMVGKAVEDANARLSRPEQVKTWELLGVEWTAESEELTPTLKLKRRVVHTKYADTLDGLYTR